MLCGFARREKRTDPGPDRPARRRAMGVESWRVVAAHLWLRISRATDKVLMSKPVHCAAFWAGPNIALWVGKACGTDKKVLKRPGKFGRTRQLSVFWICCRGHENTSDGAEKHIPLKARLGARARRRAKVAASGLVTPLFGRAASRTVAENLRLACRRDTCAGRNSRCVQRSNTVCAM